MTTLLWLRQDLRLSDQPALAAALAEGPVIPVYILDDQTPKHRKMGGASRWWLHHSLAALDAELREKGSRLILRCGRADDELDRLADETGTRRVHALRHYEPWWRNAERAVGNRLDLCLHDGNYLVPPGSTRTQQGGLYRIYTPFWRALSANLPPPAPLPAPRAVPGPADWPGSDRLADWHLLPTKPDWAGGLAGEWTPGEEGVRDRLDEFADIAACYGTARDLPSDEGTSRLSPHLHFGELSPAQVWHRVADKGGSVATFLGELGWRDYAANLLLDFPDYGSRNGRAAFDDMPWRTGKATAADLDAWQRGETGYPIVDAGMRQLWTSGWIHNRVRMIVASFLIKHLLIDWREGESWFWDTLVDADYGNNSVNWQWSAGSGVDANQFGRIMAPLLQSEKFDAGSYIRRWVPELGDLPESAIHDPEAAGCRPDAYPAKIIGHREARERALEAGKMLR